MTTSDRTDSTVTIQLTRGFTTIVDGIDRDLCRYSWRAVDSGAARNHIHAVRDVCRGSSQSPRLHRAIMERILGRSLSRYELVDHKDRNTLNNRRSNLRIATKAQNNWNSTRRRDNKSGYKGVYFNNEQQKWVAGIRVSKKRIHLGYFATAQDAYKAYCEAARHYFGDFANFGDS